MIIKNGCVTLRAIEEKDSLLLLQMLNSPEIERAVGKHTPPISEKMQREWIEKYQNTDQQIRWMIELDNGVTIGTIMLFDINMKNGTAEIGYKILAPIESRMQGDMNDAVQGVLRYAFDELRLNCIVAHALVDNCRSERLLLRNGFVEEGVLRQRVYQNGIYVDMKSFSILRNEMTSKGE